MTKFLRLFAAALLLPLLAVQAQARGSEPIVNYENVAATTASGQVATPAQIKAAFEAAAATRGWQVSHPSSGKMVAVLNVRGKHTVSSDISYQPGSYSLKYRDSVNMNFRAGEGAGLIHPHYNKWVDTLVQATRIELARLP